jgi:short-subunit dehydrogenase
MSFPPKNILILGATSAIAQAIARKFASSGTRFFLVGRDMHKLDAVAADLKERFRCETRPYQLDLADNSRHKGVIETAREELGHIDLALIAHGVLPEQNAAQDDADAVLDSLNVNFNSAVSLLTHMSGGFEKQKSGTIAVISSVAGDRGRKMLYIYGAAKAGLSSFTDGLRGRMIEHGVHVLNIKPGVIATPMTKHLKKGLLTSTPEKVAVDVYKAVRRKQDILYTPGRWRAIMFIVRHIPERIFKKLTF